MKQIYFTFVVLLVTIYSCFGRPQSTIDSQQQDGPISSELDSLPAAPSSSLQAWRKLYYEPATAVQRYQSLFDDTKPQPGSPLERIQFEILSRLQQQQQNTIGGAGGSGLPWEPMYRVPEMKRQVRYRQCYFNPISCFK